MANKMLIDAAHPEETRVVVLRGSRVEEFDFEAASKKQLRGNIYLAKVTRVEPSLQAAFVDYGGNRHGFLAFSEIHPDYYQIPVSDRQALLEAEAEEEPEEEERRPPRRSRRHRRDRSASAENRNRGDSISEPAEPQDLAATEDSASIDQQSDAPAQDVEAVIEAEPTTASSESSEATVAVAAIETMAHDDKVDAGAAHAEEKAETKTVEAKTAETKTDEAHADVEATKDSESPVEPVTAVDSAKPEVAVAPEAVASAESEDGHAIHKDHEAHGDEASSDVSAADTESTSDESSDDDEEGEDEEDVSEHVEQLGGDAMEEIPVRAYRHRRQYKIQEVIKRRQVLLVQVVKEERGNKGAALTTYLSLAGRYSVLMPNTAKGGGISRKITDAGDRQRLKSIAQDLEVPEGMGVILRTAGASRTKPEVKRDFEYLMRMWETVRETTLGSQAPTLVYEEGSLIKRAIRDLYNKDVDEVIVSGEAGYREAKDFMRLLMPSHARNVQPWQEAQPLFAKAGAEQQLDAMFSSHVTLRSGGYIVINQTEALVAIDVNSGRSTREHNIEDTALRTNLEAADEVARQLRLRDLAGLIVVDFIDMEENRNNRAVEKRIKDALKNDRARIQVGRISHFGLLEMSRQRIRTGVLEGSTVVCAHCAGAGMVRSTSSIALHVLRVLEDALIADASYDVILRTRSAVALYILNTKRQHLSDLEARFGVTVTFTADESLTGTSYCAVDRGELATGVPQPPKQVVRYEPEPFVEDEDEGGEEAEANADGEAEADASNEDGDNSRRKRRRRRRGRDRDRESSGISDDAPQPSDEALGFMSETEGLRSAGEEDAEEGSSDEEASSEGENGAREPRRESGRRRRSRRGGRRNRGEAQAGSETEGEGSAEDGDEESGAEHEAAATAVPGDAMQMPESLVAKAPADEEPAHEFAVAAPTAPEPVEAKTKAEPVADTPAPVAAKPAEAEEPAKAADEPAPAPKKPELVSTEADPAQPKRSGWWQRAKATLGG